MSTHESNSSDDDDWSPASGQRRSLPYIAEPFPGENRRELTGFSGTCENTSLSDWIQLVQMNRRDAVIGIECPDGRKASLWCRDGDIIDASCEGATGEDAVYRALTWEAGKVSVGFTPFERARRIPLTTPALLLRAAVYLKDSGMPEFEPARVPSSEAPTTHAPFPALPALAPPGARQLPATLLPGTRMPPANAVPSAPPVRTGTSFELAASVSSPPPADAAPRSAPPDALAEPAAVRRRRRAPERTWVAGIALGMVPLVALTASWLAEPEDDAPRESLPMKIATHSQASRPELPVNRPPAPSPVREESPPPRTEKAVTRPWRASGKTAGQTPAPRRVVAAPVTKPPLPTMPKSPVRVKPEIKPIEERAPRIRIIEEREPKIEVIQ